MPITTWLAHTSIGCRIIIVKIVRTDETNVRCTQTSCFSNESRSIEWVSFSGISYGRWMLWTGRAFEIRERALTDQKHNMSWLPVANIVFPCTFFFNSHGRQQPYHPSEQWLQGKGPLSFSSVADAPTHPR